MAFQIIMYEEKCGIQFEGRDFYQPDTDFCGLTPKKVTTYVPDNNYRSLSYS